MIICFQIHKTLWTGENNQLLNVRGVKEVWQTEMYTAELFTLDYTFDKDETATETLKMYKI